MTLDVLYFALVHLLTKSVFKGKIFQVQTKTKLDWVYTRLCCYTNCVTLANNTSSCCKFLLVHVCYRLRKLVEKVTAYCGEIIKGSCFLDHTVWVGQSKQAISIIQYKTLNQVQTLIVRPPSMTLFICSSASDAASGRSYSTNANPLCLLAMASHDKLTFLMGPNGWNACFTVSSRTSKLIPPTYTLRHTQTVLITRCTV